MAEGMGRWPYAGGNPYKREKYWLISLLRAMGRRQEDSKGVSIWIIKHKAVGRVLGWDGGAGGGRGTIG